MLYRYGLSAVVICCLVSSHTFAQDGNVSGKIDQELAEIRQTLAEMSKALSRMADAIDRIDDTLKHRQARLELPAASSDEKSDTLPVLFSPDVERAMIPEGHMYRGFDTLKGTQDPSYRLPRSILQQPPRAKQEMNRLNNPR